MVIEYFLNWVQSASLSKRTEAAAALARAYLRDDMDVSEREDVEAAITTLLEDPAPKVRDALAEILSIQENVPRHVIISLAADTNEIATKVLSRSPVFLDQELVHMIKTFDVEKQIAIACRPWMPQIVLNAICNSGCEEACLGSLMNPASRFLDENLHAIAERFGSNTELRVILMDREDLATKTRLLLINKAGEAINAFVTNKSWLSEKRANAVVADACDKACIAYAANAPEEEVSNVVQSLIDDGRVTVAFLLRAVCMGNITLAAATFAELSNIRIERIETILSNDKKAAFKAVYDRAGLPQSAYSIFQCAISTWRKLLSAKNPENQARMPFLVTREVLQTYVMQNDQVVDELLVLLRKLAAETARECAIYKATEISNRAEVAKPVDIKPTALPIAKPVEATLIAAPETKEVIEPTIVVSEIEMSQLRGSISEMKVQEVKEDKHWDEIFGKIDRLSANKKSTKAQIKMRADKVNAYRSPLAMDLSEYIGDIDIKDEETVFTDAILNIPIDIAA